MGSSEPGEDRHPRSITTSPPARNRRPYPTGGDALREARGADRGGTREMASAASHFSRVLQEFRDPVDRRKSPSMCYSSVNQLLEPRLGGD
jgi:hypothetical protein